MLDSKRLGRRKGIPVRDGSVRQARKEAKLTLAQVAGLKVSRTAIHLIETGRCRPSLDTLEQIARQTHKPVEFFLLSPEGAPGLTETRKDLDELERLTATRDFVELINLGRALLEKQVGEEATALIRFYLGQAYCRTVRPLEALEHLRLARKAFEQVSDEWMAVEALDWEASALGLMEDPLAIAAAGEALSRCRKLDPKPPQVEARILVHLANMHVVAHSWAQAIGYYEAAVEASKGVKDLLQLAKMHHGLGTAYQRMGLPAKARHQFDKALALYSIESDLTATYRLENDLGDLLLQEGQLDSAEQHFRSALAGSAFVEMDRRGRGYILANLGEVSLRRGDLDQARQHLLDALDCGHEVGEQVVLSNAHALLGQVAFRQGDPREAGKHFNSAISILEGLDMPDRLRDCHIACAEFLYNHGDIGAAALHWKMAAEIGKQAALGFKVNVPELQARGGNSTQ